MLALQGGWQALHGKLETQLQSIGDTTDTGVELIGDTAETGVELVSETVETVAEPFLVREGLMGRTPRGRVATPRAWEHLGLVAPTGAGTLFG